MEFPDDPRIPSSPYPELREVLEMFVGEITVVFKDKLAGVYLVGSLALGDFDLDSDVDFLVVTQTELTDADMEPLQDIHQKIHDLNCYPAKHLEGSYIYIGDLNNWSEVGKKELLYFDNGSTVCEHSTHDNQWHVRWILRERGIALTGPRPDTILQTIPSNALISEIRNQMLRSMEIFQGQINLPLGFCNSRFGQSFFVLTFCRMLHSLHTGIVQSKKAGATWAKQNVDPTWHKLIDQAWQEREGVRYGIKIGQRADPALLYQTLEFMKYAVAKIDLIDAQVN
ncbi:MAG: DUF4111 domain-containing protein [Chloroflexi bacterium]|nr:DUF4111 domain-containing protein [Chloroflexota bacterium]